MKRITIDISVKLMSRKMTAGLIIAAALFCSSCSSTRNNAGRGDDGMIALTFVQINDVYEIAPLDGGKAGGMARVSSIKKQYLQQNPNTYLVMAGDFLSPSVYNSLKFEGNRIRGRQMVAAMNSAGVDLAVFGNHEFDIPEADLQNRINESKFTWISTNTFHKINNRVIPFARQAGSAEEPFPVAYTIRLRDNDGTSATIGFIGLTLPFNKAPYVHYEDVFMSAQKYFDLLKDSCDAIVAITHQSLEDDIRLARQLPGLSLIMGGHEHERHYARVGNVYITKADANAKSAYVIDLVINKPKQQLKLNTKIIDIDQRVAADPSTDSVVQYWTGIADNNYASLGFDARSICMKSGDPLDGREAYIRSTQTNFTRLIVSAIEKASPTADIAIVNAGSIRVDDILQMPVTQYDIIRSLPFGGSIMEVEMKGSLLAKVLSTGLQNRGKGGFLHFSAPTRYDSLAKTWTINNISIENNTVYKVAISDFLMTGGEANLEFLTKDNPGIVKLYPVFTELTDTRSDIRRAIIRYMEGMGQ